MDIKKFFKLIDDDNFYALFNAFRVFAILFILGYFFKLQDSFNYLPLLLVFILSLLSFLHLRLLKKFRSWTLFLLPISFVIISVITVIIFSIILKSSSDLANFVLLYIIFFLMVVSVFLAIITFFEVFSKKFRKVMYIISIVTIILMISFLFIFIETDLKGCEIDSDCIAVSDGCGCNAGGKKEAINKQFLMKHEAGFSFLTLCPMIVSNHVTCFGKPKCVNNTCIIDTDDFTVCEEHRDPNRCYQSFAVGNLNKSICEKVVDDDYGITTESCKERVEFYTYRSQARR